MPKTPGEYLIEKYPSRFFGTTPEALDRAIREQMVDPARRAGVLMKLRRDIPQLKTVPDDAILLDTFSRIDRRYGAESTPDPSRAATVQEGQRRAAGAQAYGKTVAPALGKLAAEQQAGHSNKNVQETADEIRRTVLTPGDVAEPRVPGDPSRGIPAMYERIEDMQADAAKHGLRVVQAHGGPGVMGTVASHIPAIQLQDQTGRTISELNPAASFTASQVEGMPRLNLGEITGQGSTLQQAFTETLRDIYDPATGKWFRGMDPKTADITPEGLVNPLARANGYGLREYGMDLGKRSDAETPYKVANTLAAPLAGVLGAVDKAEEAVSGALAAASEAYNRIPWQLRGLPAPVPTPTEQQESVWRKLERDNAAEAQKYFGAAKQLWDNAWGAGLPDTPEARALANQGLGATVGEALSMSLPTGGDSVVKAAAPLVSKAVGAGGRAIARQVEHAAPKAYENIVGVFSTVPASTTMGREAANVIRGGQAAARNIGDMLEIQYESSMRKALEEALPADKLDAAVREARDVWHSADLRRAASPEAQRVIEVLQPYHERAFRALFPNQKTYNPLHVFRGQDITKEAKNLETRRLWEAAQDAELAAEEMAKDVGRRVGEGFPGMPQRTHPLPRDAPWIEPRESRSWADQAEMLRTRAKDKPLLERASAMREAEEVERMDLVSGLARTFRAGKESRGIRANEAAEVFRKNIGVLANDRPGSYQMAQDRFGRSIDDLLARDADGNPIQQVNQYRDIILNKSGAGRNLLAPGVPEELAKKDEVIVRVLKEKTKDAHHVLRAIDPKQHRIVFVPSIPKEWDGMIIPRQHALAMRQAVDPSDWSRRAADIAKTVDGLLGLTQLNYAITKGNPGFEARNRISELWRLVVDDAENLSKANRELVQRVLSSDVNGKTAESSMHRELLRLGGLGKGVIEDMRGGKNINPGPVWMSDRWRSILNAPTRAAEVVQDKLVNERLRRGLFPNLPKQYSVEDAFRAAVMLAEMKKGVRPTDAAANMKRLLIDYSDYSAAERAAKLVVPFIKYYTGAAEGALAVAMKNPRKFARVYDMARILERWDTEFDGGGHPVNKKIKSLGQVVGGAPLVQEGDSFVALRPETTAAEASAIGEMIDVGLGGLDPNAEHAERGVGSLVGPGVASVYDWLTGRNLATGRSQVGLSGLERLRAEAEGATTGPGQALWAYRKRSEGDVARTANDMLALGRDLLRYIPIASRIGDAPWLRFLGGLGTGQTNPAARSDEALSQALRRALRSQTTGLRSETMQPSQEQLSQLRRVRGRIPPSWVDIRAKNIKQGKVAQ